MLLHLEGEENAEIHKDTFYSWKYFCNVLPFVLNELNCLFRDIADGPALLEAQRQSVLRSSNSSDADPIYIGVHARVGDRLDRISKHQLERVFSNIFSRTLSSQSKTYFILLLCGGPPSANITENKKSVTYCAQTYKNLKEVAASYILMDPHEVVQVDTTVHSPEEDMALLAHCSYLITTKSTFSFFPGLFVTFHGGMVFSVHGKGEIDQDNFALPYVFQIS